MYSYLSGTRLILVYRGRAVNRRSVQEARPKACRGYPHTDQKGMQGILRITARNAPSARPCTSSPKSSAAPSARSRP